MKEIEENLNVDLWPLMKKAIDYRLVAESLKYNYFPIFFNKRTFNFLT